MAVSPTREWATRVPSLPRVSCLLLISLLENLSENLDHLNTTVSCIIKLVTQTLAPSPPFTIHSVHVFLA